MAETNRQIRLKSRPVGRPAADNFDLVTGPRPQPADGEVLRRTLFLSLDPYMRGRMSDAPSYAAPVNLGDVMCGHTVSEVIASRHPKFQPGDRVAGYDGWQEYAASDPKDLRKLDRSIRPTAALGVLGMPGLTAYVGLIDIGQPKAGETVVVSAASGAVGSVVGQLATLRGCRAVGIAGSDEKCRFVVEELGFDACVNYKTAGDLRGALAAACPTGIDVYFENVGGAILAAVLRLLNRGARIPLCGLIAEYNATDETPGPNLRPLLVHRAMIRGFIVSDHFDRTPAFQQEVGPLVRSGRLKYREDIVDGLENAPAALLRLFDGGNFGKLIVRVSDEIEL